MSISSTAQSLAADSDASSMAPPGLTLPEELILLLLNEESGYFHQVPGWSLHCAMAGAALAELSLLERIDTDLDSVIVLDRAPTGNPISDLVLMQIAANEETQNAQYWIEQLAPRAEMLIDLTLDRLVNFNILEHHDGEFWNLTPAARHGNFVVGDETVSLHHVKARVDRLIFGTDIPNPRDIIVIALTQACDVLRFIFDLDQTATERIELIGRMDLIGRAIADAVAENLTGSLLHQSALTKPIPKLPLRRLMFSRLLRRGNIPAAFAGFAEEYGPVYQVKLPWSKSPLIFLTGLDVNRWVHRHGRMFLRSSDYMRGLEAAYHASGLLPALDGPEHFRMRKAVRASYSRGRFEQQLSAASDRARGFLSDWNVGDTRSAVALCRELANAVVTPFLVSVSADDVLDDIIDYKSRALKTHVVNILPNFMLKTPGIKRKAKAVDVLYDRVLRSHTATQRSGQPRDHADDILALHRSDSSFVPESNLRFQFSAAALASMYLGDELTFLLHEALRQPHLLALMQTEADALFEDGDLSPEAFNPASISVTHRFIIECLRLYPTVTSSVRTVMNTCIVEDHELPSGTKIFIMTTAPHYMHEYFPDPYTFDIERHGPTRSEHRTPAYAPYGLGTHRCLGSHAVELMMTLLLMMLVHHFDMEMRPKNYRLKIDAFPSMSPSKRFKVMITGKRHELPASSTSV